jgi:hypothetical protein
MAETTPRTCRNQLTVNLVVTSEEVAVQVADRRPQTVALFAELSGEQGRQFAAEVWTVGLRAIATAHAHAQEARLEDIGKQFIENFDGQLGKFFDPANGQLPKSLAAFVDDKGDLSQLLTKSGDELVKNIDTKISEALDPRLEKSGATLFLKELKALLTENAGTHTDALDRILKTIGQQEERRNEPRRGGKDFEAAVLEFVTEELSGPGIWIVEDVNGKPGHIPYNKKGDHVIDATDESAFAGARVVIEAKRERQYTMADALKELAEARKNRKADVGLFVLAKSVAPEGFPDAIRVGRDVLVKWDHEDPLTDIRLACAVWLATALLPLKVREGNEGDIRALADIAGRFESELTRLSKMQGYTDGARRNLDSLDEEIRKAKEQLRILLGKAKDTLLALHVELVDEATERLTPIGLPTGSLGHAKLDTTALYTRVANRTIRTVTSPLDRLAPLTGEKLRTGV